MLPIKARIRPSRMTDFLLTHPYQLKRLKTYSYAELTLAAGLSQPMFFTFR